MMKFHIFAKAVRILTDLAVLYHGLRIKPLPSLRLGLVGFFSFFQQNRITFVLSRLLQSFQVNCVG